MNLFTKQKQTYWLRKYICGYQRGNMEGIIQEFGINVYVLLYIEQIINMDLLYSTGNLNQYSVITKMKKEYENEQICVHV